MRSTLRAAALAVGLFACAAPADDAREPTRARSPYVLVLGTAQDGGLPQIGCELRCCRAARADPRRARLTSALLLADPRSGKRWLLDAGPSLPAQVERAKGHPPGRVTAGARPPLFDGVLLTHAHVGHYAGLLALGPEAYGAHELAVYGSRRMATFLEENGPWSLLVQSGAIWVKTLVPGETLALEDDLTVRALLVPHRDEFTDTLAFIVRGPERSLLYLPDIDKWERWDTRIEDVLSEVDVALLDGTFFEDGEVPGRSLADIPHPFVVESLTRFAPLPADERAKIRFTHLNHTNPLADPASDAAKRVRRAGMGVAQEGDRFDL